MRKQNALRVAPSRGGIPVANAWRFWAQGDEFYAAARDVAKLGKVSFHSNGNWQFRAGAALNRLAPASPLSNGWLLALQLVFLVDPDVMLPLDQREEGVRLLETPDGFKLLVDLLLSKGSSSVPPPLPSEIGGAMVAAHRLRNGTHLVATTRTMGLTAADQGFITDLRAKLRINFTGDPPASGFYAEATWQTFNTEANLIGVIPVGQDSLAREPGQRR
jgi:hypothetical protein